MSITDLDLNYRTDAGGHDWARMVDERLFTNE